MACSGPPKPPTLVLWAWERPEDLRFLEPGEAEVAVLAGTLYLDGDRVRAQPRAWPLHVNPGTPVTAVVRIETDAAALSDHQLELTADWVRQLAARPAYVGLQLDFDAVTSERTFYRRLLERLRPEFERLSMTALASWCFEDPSWLQDLPIDEVVPMLFRMGPAGDRYRAAYEQDGFPAVACGSAVGLATDEPLGSSQVGSKTEARTVYLFHPEPWTPAAWSHFRAVAD